MCRHVKCIRAKAQNTNVGDLSGRQQEGTKYTFFAVLAKWQGSRNLSACGWAVRIL
jgi:hypothetical protein